MVLVEVNRLVFAVREAFSREILDRLDWMENDEADVFLRSTRIRFAGDMMLAADVAPNFAALLMVVEVERPMDLRFSSNSLFLIFSLMVFSSWVLLGVLSGWFN